MVLVREGNIIALYTRLYPCSSKIEVKIVETFNNAAHGTVFAGAHHLNTFTKDQHDIRLNHRDKQNFDTVTRITSPSMLGLLEKVPDGKGILKYLELMKNFVDAVLDKGLSPLERIKKVWFTIFFLRYWHRWLSLHKKYTVKENFITSNANSGIELNGHALLSLVILMRDKIPNGDALGYSDHSHVNKLLGQPEV